MRCPLHRFGLTLIELLLVIGIIALLAGIIWVVFAPARENARRMLCISNLKQIGLAYQMYREDWEGLDPEKGVPRQYWELGLPPGKKRTLVVLGYIKDERILICPNWFIYSDEIVGTSYRSTYGPDYGRRDRRPFSWRIAQMPDYPIEVCMFHDPAMLLKLSPSQIKQVLGLTVIGEVKWYDYPSIRKLEIW
ncbi:MAG: DUF1559 domain-containing protein [Armatimonadota bacterium]|nr:DUF1559 domain-containing protein [Armatimonadota bacterium]